MDWKDVAAPMIDIGAGLLGSLIGGEAGDKVGATVGSLAAQALGVPARPEAVAAAITSDPQAAAKLQELETQRSAEFMALQTEGLKLMAQLASKEGDSFFHAGWRPALSWIVATIVLQTFLVSPWARAIAGVDVSVPYDQVLGIAAIWLTIYGGGHTVKSIFEKRLSK